MTEEEFQYHTEFYYECPHCDKGSYSFCENEKFNEEIEIKCPGCKKSIRFSDLEIVENKFREIMIDEE